MYSFLLDLIRFAACFICSALYSYLETHTTNFVSVPIIKTEFLEDSEALQGKLLPQRVSHLDRIILLA